MDFSLPAESLPQADFENTQNEDAGEAARWGYIYYSECNFTDLFDITNINKNQQSSSLHNENESDNGSRENETEVVPSKRKKTKKMVIVKF